MLTRKAKLTLMAAAGFIAIGLYIGFLNTGDGRWTYPQFPGFFAALMMCGGRASTCHGADGAMAILTWILFTFVQYYAILRLFAWIYLKVVPKR